MVKAGKREFFRFVNDLRFEVRHGAVKDALRLGANRLRRRQSRLKLCFERRPPKLDLDIYAVLGPSTTPPPVI